MAAKLTGGDRLWTLRLQMSEEVNLIPFDKSTLAFNNAANVLETWIQKYEVARDFGSHVEAQKMVAILQRIVDAIRNSNGEPDQDACETNPCDIEKQNCCRSREVATSKVAMKTTMTNREKISAVAAGTDNRQETEKERRERYANMVYKYFASDDGCKKGQSCEARHVLKEKGCKVCGSNRSMRHPTHKCDAFTVPFIFSSCGPAFEKLIPNCVESL
eukprot:2265170-Amphidinium_carterae.2